jgi:hypothetical protein
VQKLFRQRNLALELCGYVWASSAFGAEDFRVLKKKEQPLHFYDRENMPYEVDRKAVAERAHWLKLAPWQVFCTYTFGGRPPDEETEQVFGTYINQLEHSGRADISYVCGHEKRFSGCGKPASGRHFHTVMASAAPLSPAILEFFWTSIPGNRRDSANVRPYDPTRNGVLYILKSIDQQHGDWSFRKLHLVLPGIDVGSLNHGERRNLQRHQARLKAFAIKPPKLMPGGCELTDKMPQTNWSSLL